MKKIFIDDTPLRTGHASRGMGMYTRNLIESVKKNLNYSKLEFSEKNYDLIHIPYFDLYFYSLKNLDFKRKVVITVPDVIPLLFPDKHPSGFKGKIKLLFQKRALKKADAIITISETSKKDIIRLLGIDSSKIIVTYLAPNFKFKKVSKFKLELPQKFVLYVGDVNYNKNLITLVKACKKAKIKLVIVGKQAVSEDFDKNHIENKDLKLLLDKYRNDKDIIRLGFLSEEELNEVWNKATIYCQSSFYEGFGLPVLEAMQASVPVISSKTQALVEVCDDACLFFDPHDLTDLSGKIKFLMNNSRARQELIKKGQKRVKLFSWDKMSQEVIAVYKKVLTS